MVARSSSDPAPGSYHVFHHVFGEKAPKLYVCPHAPEIKGAFVHLIDEDGQEVWLSGNLTVRQMRVKEGR